MIESTNQTPNHLITRLRGIGPQVAQRLQKCGIQSCQDLLFHLPIRYQDRTRLTPIANCRPGDYVVVEGVLIASNVMIKRRRVWICRLQDMSGSLQLVFFHFNNTQRQRLKLGTQLRCFGEVRRYQQGLSIIHPETQIVSQSQAPVEEHLTPIYPTTEGLSQQSIRQFTAQALQINHKENICHELLPLALREQFNLMAIEKAIEFIHHPPPDVSCDTLLAGEHPAQQRLAFEELLANQCALLRIREKLRSQQAPQFALSSNTKKKLLEQLPFTLTAAQQKCIKEIEQDLQTSSPMLRLLQGDVGSGKTIVAAVSACHAMEANFQVALMAPTEILAEQHYQTFEKWFAPLGINVMFLSGKLTGRERQEILTWLQRGEIQCLIGTHALFQASVEFQQLGLVIIDEQHRFGVHQRLALSHKGRDKSLLPHQLVLTATPIPRTLAMTAYADLDLSIINERPPGRLPIKTVVMPNSKRDDVIERVKAVINSGRQVYWVCTLIEESDVLQAQAAEQCAEYLREALAEHEINLIHGRMPKPQKDDVMQQFCQGRVNVLVATTVIEVGVDVPNASLMVIENAERLGLAQLHQLRGRVGRGTQESFCVLLYQNPLSEQGKERLAIMRETDDGFKIASKDLELRGPGEVLGTKQTGLVRMRIADIIRDQALLPAVKQAATILLTQYPKLVPQLIKRWLGDNEKYSKV